MAQCIYEVQNLPERAIDANAAFVRDHLESARSLIAQNADESLVIVLRSGDHSHTDWRRAIARDLARAHAPARVNLIAGKDGDELSAALEYLDSANGVTGHYLEVHE